MTTKISRLSFLILLSCMMLTPFFQWLLQPAKEMSIIEGRILKDLPTLKLSLQDIKTGIKRIRQNKPAESWALIKPQLTEIADFLTSRGLFETGSVDQFPQRQALIQASRAIERTVIWTAYASFCDEVLPASARSNRMVLRKDNMFLPQPDEFTYKTLVEIDARIRNFEAVMQASPQATFFIFYVDDIAQSPYHPAAQYYPLAANEAVFRYIQANKPDGMIIGSDMITSFEDFRQKFYRTDHHWKTQGMWKGYQGIYHMIARYYPKITPMLEPSTFTEIPSLGFCGSYARQTLYPCQPESIAYPKVTLPPYTIRNQGQIITVGHYEEFLNGAFPDDPYDNLLGKFWGGEAAILHYENLTIPDGNLLIIGDSFSNSIERYLAAHYRNTYTMDLRHHKKDSLSSLIEKNSINHVLILGTPQVLFTQAWEITP